MNTLRTWLWNMVYVHWIGGAKPKELNAYEILASVLIAVFLWVILWYILKYVFFLIAESTVHSRLTAAFFGLIIAIAWLCGAQEWYGEYCNRLIFIIISIGSLITFTFLMLIRRKPD